jgi:hypothetical protein
MANSKTVHAIDPIPGVEDDCECGLRNFDDVDPALDFPDLRALSLVVKVD